MQFPLQCHLQGGNTQGSLLCALADLVRLAGPLPVTGGAGAGSAPPTAIC